MLVPLKNCKKVEKTYRFERDVPMGLSIEVEKDDKVSKDTVLASGEIFKEKSRIDISAQLGVKPEKARTHLLCLNGERVTKGDTIALRKGKILGKEKKSVTDSSGVVNLSEIEKGVVKIFDDAKAGVLRSGISGKVASIIKSKKIIIETEAVVVKPFHIYGKSVCGNLFFFDKKVEDIERKADLSGSVVALKYTPNIDDLRQFSVSGVNGLILSAISENLRKIIYNSNTLGISVCSINGFGMGDYDRTFVALLKSNDGSMVFLDGKEKEVVFTCFENFEELELNSQVAKLSGGDKIQYITSEGFIDFGEITELGSEVTKVKSINNRKIEVNNLNILKLS